MRLLTKPMKFNWFPTFFNVKVDVNQCVCLQNQWNPMNFLCKSFIFFIFLYFLFFLYFGRTPGWSGWSGWSGWAGTFYSLPDIKFESFHPHLLSPFYQGTSGNIKTFKNEENQLKSLFPYILIKNWKVSY